MLTFEFEIAPSIVNGQIDGLSRGHLTISGSHGFVTSKGKTPDQSMMIFLSIVELLNGVRRLLLNRNSITYNFVGADCSFQFSINKTNQNSLAITSDIEPIDEVTQSEIVLAVWNGVNNFISFYGHHIDADDLVSDDLDSSIDEFRKTFNLTN
ncbi:MAG: hypothetical protein M3430_02550 [Acidobacteriota bacterium]|nr:hypothetical protein [Acidobacteriota bacterium]